VRMTEDECVMHVWRAFKKTKPMVLLPYRPRGAYMPFTFDDIDKLQQDFIREVVRAARQTLTASRDTSVTRRHPLPPSTSATKRRKSRATVRRS
jgi:hypothetical protein